MNSSGTEVSSVPKVGDKDLKTRTLQGIKKRLTAANVLDETFSFFTSKLVTSLYSETIADKYEQIP